MESTIDYLKRKLIEVGPSEWQAIAKDVDDSNPGVKVTRHTLRKIAYGERPNLGTQKADALRAYFQGKEKAELSPS
jgi:hypothetical protein